MTSSPLVETSAVELRRLIGAKVISPVELLDACIDRIGSVNPHVNAVTATCFERARVEAQAAERAVMAGEPLGLLHGLPLGVKDLEPTEGLLTTWGSAIYRAFPKKTLSWWRVYARPVRLSRARPMCLK